MTILLLIRHASNDYLKAGRLAGWTPGVHLNAQGQAEANTLAQRLNHVALHAIYASPLERAQETAHAVAQCQQLAVHTRVELGEVNAGEWTGKAIKDLEQTDAWKRMLAQPVDFCLPGGEGIAQVQTRMIVALEQIIAAHPHQTVAIFSHADPIKAVVAHYLGMHLNQFNKIVIDPASVTVFFFDELGAKLFRLNDAGALPEFKPAHAPAEQSQGVANNGRD